ncbi:MAG: hypothetical protein AB2A00_12340 [Myxococcota bacterium]
MSAPPAARSLPSAPVVALSIVTPHELRREKLRQCLRLLVRGLMGVSGLTAGVLAVMLPVWWVMLGVCFEGPACRGHHLQAIVETLMGLGLSCWMVVTCRCWEVRLSQPVKTLAEFEAEFLGT